LNIKNEVSSITTKHTHTHNQKLTFFHEFICFQAGAEDLRIKMEMRQLQSPLGPTSAPPTPTTPIASYTGTGKGLGGLVEGTIATTDMLNVLSAHRESVNTADGKSSSSTSLLPH
jgi:hypothetical protein